MNKKKQQKKNMIFKQETYQSSSTDSGSFKENRALMQCLHFSWAMDVNNMITANDKVPEKIFTL